MARVKSEYEVESLFIDRLQEMDYTYISLNNYDDVVANFRVQFCKVNRDALIAKKGTAELPLMQGIKVTSISKGSIQDTIISYPCIEEQQKIVYCLLALDETIQLKKQKLVTWKNVKKGLLQQMFV